MNTYAEFVNCTVGDIIVYHYSYKVLRTRDNENIQFGTWKKRRGETASVTPVLRSRCQTA